MTADSAEELNRLGLSHLREGRLSEASTAFEEAIRLKHDFAEAYCNLGRASEQQGQFDDATDCYRLAAHFAPDSMEASFSLARALESGGSREEALTVLQEAAGRVPASAMAHYKTANLLRRLGRAEEAVGHYRRAIDLKPGFTDAHSNLGLTFRDIGHFGEARAQCEAALRLDPDLPEAHQNLGLVLMAQGEPSLALESFRKAFDLNPNLVESLASIGHALRDLGRLDEAISHYDDALRRRPGFGDAVINRCYAYLLKEDYDAGWAEYEKRFVATGTSDRGFPFRAWNGEPLAGRTLLVYAEQGLGDEIMFASCVPDVLAVAAGCIIECNSRLAPLFRRSFGGARVHGGNKTDAHTWLADTPVDYQASIGSLPRFFRGTRGAFPRHRGYLRADAGRAGHWTQTLASLGTGIKVGISWRGGTHKSRGGLRSIPPAAWRPLFGRPGAHFVSLQYGEAGDALRDFRGQCGTAPAHWPQALDDLDETAALISALDLVVSVDNTVAHLAGALGRPLHVLLPSAPEWRYGLGGERMPWYPSARLFRQSRSGDWGVVMAAAAAALLPNGI